MFEEHDETGSLEELAKFIFRESSHPGAVCVQDESLTPPVLFNTMADLYMMGVKLYNHMNITDQFDSLAALPRADTASWVAERMATTVGIRPTLEMLPTDENAPLRIVKGIGPELDTCWIVDNCLGCKLSMRFEHH